MIASCVLVDQIEHFGSKGSRVALGGAGLHASAGAILAGGAPRLLTGVGHDFSDLCQDWAKDAGLDIRHVKTVVDQTPKNRIVYYGQDRRTETPILGHDHFKQCEAKPTHIIENLHDARSLYIFRNLDPHFWRTLRPAVKDMGLPILWELSNEICAPENLPRVSELADIVTAISLNLSEAKALVGSDDAYVVTKTLGALPFAVIFLRSGADGSLIIHQTPLARVIDRVPTLDIRPVDVTGGGNTYSAAALVGLATGLDPLQAAFKATAAAVTAIEFSGVCPAGSHHARTIFAAKLEQLKQANS